MTEIAPHEPYLDGISADAVASYAEGTGLWNLISHPNPKLRVYSGPLDDSGQPFHLVIPIHDQFRDIRVRLAAAISLIAALEDRSPYTVIDDLRKSSEDLFEQSLSNINRLGLSQIPFVENSVDLKDGIL